jgi:hypothetical protein
VLNIRVEDPVRHARVGVVDAVGRVLPVGLDLAEQRVLVLLGALLDLLALAGEVVRQLVGIPLVWVKQSISTRLSRYYDESLTVGLDDVVLPVGLDLVEQVLAVSGRGVGDVVVRQPALQLRLVPEAC